MPRQTLIKDPDFAKSLDTLGFCVVPLFDPGQIKAIKELYHQFSIDNKVQGLIASHSKTTAEQSKDLRNKIGEVVMPSLKSNFENFDLFIAGFMIKEGNTQNELPLHQDWNILDESKGVSYQIWVPLELSHPENGGMIVLPGSHRYFNNYRSGSYGIPVVNMDDAIKPMLVNMIIPPGSALVFHNSLFHASYPNYASANRVAAIISVYQKDVPLNYYDKNVAENRTDVYGITPEIFLQSLNKLENKGQPDNPLFHTTTSLNPIENDKITSADLVQGFKKMFGDDIKAFEPAQLQILRDEALQKKMARDGYVVVDLLDEDTMAELKEKYLENFGVAQTAIGRFTAMEHTTPATRNEIHNFLLNKVRPFLDRYLKDYQTPIASYMAKYAHSAGDLSWHTDSSLLLNTHLEPHYGLWCPLLDVNEKNGALCVVEGSHKFSHAIYLGGIQWPFLSYANRFDKNRKVFDLKAGQMIIFDMRLIHNATPNDTDDDRVCFAARITHQKSKFYSFLCDETDNSIVNVFEESPNVYLADQWTGDNQVVGLLNKVGQMKNVHSRINFAALEAQLAE